ncbi:MAG: alpha/beta hydrolase-fold protein, partial [Bacteroidota bacterium]
LTLFTNTILAQLTIKIAKVPASTPAMDNIHIAGDFQAWNPSDPNYILTNNEDGTYEITFIPAVGQIEFKFARGEWAKVEGNADGNVISNRTLNYTGSPQTEELQIQGWEDLDGGMSSNSTAADNVFLFDANFEIPQLGRERKIWIYLPPDYEDSEKFYPVIYMQDGQNVFDAATSFSGEWEVDESLNRLFEEGDFGCIVVAIENGGANRINEYSAWNNPQYGGGEGAQYLEFIVNTLKPKIDANYRTLPGREYTGLLGSSLGGLISHYGIVEHQETFSKAGIFSPSYWFVDEIYQHTKDTEKEFSQKLYLLGGQNEGGSMAQKINDMYNVLLEKGYGEEEVLRVIHADGEHAEWYWRREFPAVYKWLFGDFNLTSIEKHFENSIEVYPNPADSSLSIEGLKNVKSLSFELYSFDGKLLKKANLDSTELDVSSFENGLYLLKIFSETELVYLDKILIQR